jgi:hypothetical protein
MQGWNSQINHELLMECFLISHIRITPYQHLQNTFNIVSKVNKNPLTKSHQLVQKMFEIQFNTQHHM